MTTRADSYSSTGQVAAFTMHLLDGQTSYNSTTRPTVTQVEKFIDRCSGVLNTVMRGRGLAVPITNSTAKLACDDWVTVRATEYVELTQRGTGYSDAEGSRTAGFRSLWKSAGDFVDEVFQGFQYLGVTVTNTMSDGLQFTGLTAQADRADPTDTSLEQPMFRRHLFDESTATDFTDEIDED